MRDDLVKKNIIIITIGLLLFYILSIFSTSSVSRRSLEQQLVSVSKVIYTQVDEVVSIDDLYKLVDTYTIDQDWLRIVIADADGLILKDSTDDSIGSPYYSFLEKSELEIVQNYDSENDRLYLHDEEIFFITTQIYTVSFK